MERGWWDLPWVTLEGVSFFRPEHVSREQGLELDGPR